MKPSKQNFFNQFRENTIIEVVQTVAKSEAGGHLAFKGGTALKLFYDLPRYSEDIDYDFLGKITPQEMMDILKTLVSKKKWEITDDAVKYNTILFELRFAGPERNFRVKIEISTREKELKTTIQSLRGVPVLTLEPSFLMTEKLITFVERKAGRDIFDAWYILNNTYPLDENRLIKSYGDLPTFIAKLSGVIHKADSQKILRDTGKLLGLDYRSWINTSFLDDFQKLVNKRFKDLSRAS